MKFQPILEGKRIKSTKKKFETDFKHLWGKSMSTIIRFETGY